MKHQKPILRRTFLQERFEILIKRQQSGHATFAELTELDDIVNRDPDIRFSILEEINNTDSPTNPPQKEDVIIHQQTVSLGLFDKIKSFINGFLHFIAPARVILA